MSPISVVATIFVNFCVYIVIGTVGLMLLSGVFDITRTFNSAVVIGLVVLILEIFGKTLKTFVSAALNSRGNTVEEQTSADELYEFLEEILDVLLHTKGVTSKDETKRREMVDEISDILE